MKDLNGKTAVVTGAASGIGRAMAEKFLTQGMNVVLADIEPEQLQQTEPTVFCCRPGQAALACNGTCVRKFLVKGAIYPREMIRFRREGS